jgi:hypothetical protein
VVTVSRPDAGLRRDTRRAPRRRLGGAALLVAACSFGLPGCVALPPLDDSFETRIPEALESADLGYTDAWAEKTIDGFTTELSVGVDTVASDVTTNQLEQTIALIVAENTLGGDRLDLSVWNAEEQDFISLDDQAIELGADPIAPNGNSLMIDIDEARAIARGASE